MRLASQAGTATCMTTAQDVQPMRRGDPTCMYLDTYIRTVVEIKLAFQPLSCSTYWLVGARHEPPPTCIPQLKYAFPFRVLFPERATCSYTPAAETYNPPTHTAGTRCTRGFVAHTNKFPLLPSSPEAAWRAPLNTSRQSASVMALQRRGNISSFCGHQKLQRWHAEQ